MKNVKLLYITKNAEILIEKAYRNCWQSKPKNKSIKERRDFIKRCISMGHLSPLEFADAVFEILGSRAFTHQLVRHRLASYAQESQRHVKIKDLSYFVIPKTIKNNKEALKIFKKSLKEIFNSYESLIQLGIPKEDARYILPNATMSRIFVKMNFRAWRHFLKLRCDTSAQWEIRDIAKEILKILYKNSPSVFEDLYEKFIKGTRKDLFTEKD
jgi:thymidylate synthase (FAD)